MNILTVNLLFSTMIFWIAARIYILPKLPGLEPQAILLPILLLHSFRHLGLMFLAPGATYQGIPKPFAYPAAFGDLLAAVLAIAAIAALVWRARSARFLVWVFNVEGTLDLLAAIVLATVHGAAPYMGAAYWIPAFWVPALLVTHSITFIVLRRHWMEPAYNRSLLSRRTPIRLRHVCLIHCILGFCSALLAIRAPVAGARSGSFSIHS